MRTKQLISYPHLNDCKGDLSKRWYVEYAFRLPGDPQEHRYRMYDGLCSGDEQSRRASAQRLINYYTDYLKSGRYLLQQDSLDPVLPHETFRPEVERYNKQDRQLHVSTMMDDYLDYIRPSLRYSSYRTFRGCLLEFQRFVEQELDDMPIYNITRTHVIPFFTGLAASEGKNLCRKTIKRYIGNVQRFFEYCIDTWLESGLYPDFRNPIWKIPNNGKIVDCSPALIETNERELLKQAILPRQPYLWLACELEYYCALRPGHEIRLLRVGDVDRVHKVITVQATVAKNKRTEKVDVPSPVLELMEKLNVFQYDRNLYIFTKNGFPGEKPLAEHYLARRYSMFRDSLGIPADRHFYSWKHTGAVSAADNGMSIYDLKDHLRHKSIATTEQYLRKKRPKKSVAEQFIDVL